MENADTEAGNAKLKEILENGCWGSRLGYANRSNSDKKIRKETEKTKPVNTDTKVKMNKVHLKPIKFNPSADVVKSVNEVGSTSAPRSNLNTDKSEPGNKRNSLVLDSGCSRHMTGYKSLVSESEEKAGPSVSYGDGNLGKILGYGKIKIENVIIENVALVAGLKHNLISVSHIYDRGYNVNFYEEHCEIVSKSDGKIVMTGKAKQRKISFKSKTGTSILESYYLLHIDFFGPLNVMSIAKKRYVLVIVDEYTRYTWVYFLHTKDESPSILLDHVREMEKGSTYKVKIIRSDNGTEFKNSSMEEFCKFKGIKQEFSAPGTPQQNGVVERKNRTLIEDARTML
ncbi:hypothetical protein AgCh_038130 [Apium graveolens]